MAAAMKSQIKRGAAGMFLAGTLTHVKWRVQGRAGPRVFGHVRIVAAMGRQNGITSGAHLQFEAMKRAGYAAQLVDATASLRNPLAHATHEPGSVYIMHSGGPQTACLLAGVLPHAANAYRIAYWAWELPDPPKSWIPTARIVSEIWTPSQFAKDSLAKQFDLPIHVVPHVVLPKAPRVRNYKSPFTVLAMADSRSSFTRKNPSGAVNAFREAFGNSGAARLILKLSGNGSEVEELAAELAAVPNISVLRRHLDSGELNALYRSADVMLSLHRAEGFGLPMLEAMAHGTPVVGTGWSGNLDYMNASNGVLVPYRLVPVLDAAGVYSDSQWAEADIGVAAQALRRLAADHAYHAGLAKGAHDAVVQLASRWPATMLDAAG